MTRFLISHAWMGVLAGLLLLLVVPNALLRKLSPVQGAIPTLTPQPTADTLGQSFQHGLQLAATDPAEALPLLQQVMFSDHPDAEKARTLARGIQTGQLDDDPAYLYTATGRSLAAIGEWELARTALLQAVQLDPQYAEAWAYLGEAQYQTGEDSQASLEHALELNPDSMAAQLFNALYWQRKGDFDQATLHYYVAAQLDPENPSIYVQWGQEAMLAGDPINAKEHFENAAKLTPDDPQVWVLLAQFSVDSELYVEELGIPAAQKALQISGPTSQILVLLGRASASLGYPLSAEVFLNHALDMDADYVPAHLYLGLFLLGRERTSEALGHFNRVIALAPDSAEARWATDLIVQYSP